MQVIRNLFRKNRFQEGDIVYLQRHDRKTLICLAEGRVITTYEPLKNVRITTLYYILKLCEECLFYRIILHEQHR